MMMMMMMMMKVRVVRRARDCGCERWHHYGSIANGRGERSSANIELTEMERSIVRKLGLIVLGHVVMGEGELGSMRCDPPNLSKAHS
jgi:MoaA/NifB/PqqE/SkfB family radical SAM enzyme